MKSINFEIVHSCTESHNIYLTSSRLKPRCDVIATTPGMLFSLAIETYGGL